MELYLDLYSATTDYVMMYLKSEVQMVLKFTVLLDHAARYLFYLLYSLLLFIPIKITKINIPINMYSLESAANYLVLLLTKLYLISLLLAELESQLVTSREFGQDVERK